jgi:hypothetical protein
MSKICALIAIPSEIIEGSTYDILNKKWPNAAIHDGVNKIFNGSIEGAEGVIIASEELPDDGNNDSYLDDLVAWLQVVLFEPDRTSPIYIENGLMSALYRHSEYQEYLEIYRASLV